MANYSLTINSKFRPFSYAEMVAPVQAMTQAHQAIEDKYAELMSKASVWENMANEQRDPKAYAMYKYYSSQLMLAADDLSRNGLTAQSRPQLMALAAGYSKYIDPIEKAYEARAKDIERQQTLIDSTGDRTVFTNYADQSSLDSYLYGNKPRYQSENLDKVMNEGMQGAAAISSRIQGTALGTAFDKDFYDFITVTGLDISNINDVVYATQELLNRKPEYKPLKEYWDTMLEKTRAVEGSSPYSEGDRRRIEASLKQGMAAGLVYKKEHNWTVNWRKKMKEEQAFEAAQQAARIAAQERMQKDELAARSAEAAKDREFKAHLYGFETDGNGNITRYTGNGPRSISGRSSTSNVGRIGKPVKVNTRTGESTVLDKASDAAGKTVVPYSQLSPAEKAKVDIIIQGDSPENYLYFRDADTHWFWDDDPLITVVPKSVGKETKDFSSSEEYENAY